MGERLALAFDTVLLQGWFSLNTPFPFLGSFFLFPIPYPLTFCSYEHISTSQHTSRHCILSQASPFPVSLCDLVVCLSYQEPQNVSASASLTPGLDRSYMWRADKCIVECCVTHTLGCCSLEASSIPLSPSVEIAKTCPYTPHAYGISSD